MSEEKYDSLKDYNAHLVLVKDILKLITKELEQRAEEHDLTKTKEPEKSCYDYFVPLLKKHKYGSPQYELIRKQMEEQGLKHHYQHNRHHPEYFTNGINGMTLVDLVECFADWVAASQRSDTKFDKSIGYNVKKFKVSPQLEEVLKNTWKVYFRDKS